jgi:hypothetical protein
LFSTGSFKNLQKQHKFLGYFLLRKKSLSINFDKKWFGLYFGRFFSPTLLVTLLPTILGRFLGVGGSRFRFSIDRDLYQFPPLLIFFANFQFAFTPYAIMTRILHLGYFLKIFHNFYSNQTNISLDWVG